VSFDLIVFDAEEPLTPEAIQQRFSEAEERFAADDAEFPEASPATPRLQALVAMSMPRRVSALSSNSAECRSG